MAMTNNQVFNFSGSNIELCNLLGIERQEGQPDHWHNYSIRPLKQKAGIEVAKGNGDEVFELKSSRRNKSTVPANQSPAQAVYALPGPLAAILPAITVKLQAGGNDISSGIKQWLKENSQPATQDSEAVLPDDVIDVLGFFGLDSSDNETALLAYAGVKTMRSLQIERLNETIKALSSINLESLTDDRLDDLERQLLSFALTGSE